MNVEELTQVSDKQLARAFGSPLGGGEQITQEVVNRGLFTDREMDLISSKSVSVGMTENALIASWGRPEDINRTVGSYGVQKQYVYGRISEYSSRKYVYVEDGLVTSWQD